MAKRAGAKKSQFEELNPGFKAAGAWVVYRPGTMSALSINADHLDVTDSGALIFMVGGSNAPPQIVIAADQYLYCTKVR